VNAGTAGFLAPDWPAPPGVGAVMTLRSGGASSAPYGSFNLGTAVGDDPAAVAANRARLLQRLGGARPAWLRQVHGSTVLRLDEATPERPEASADAAWTATPGRACVVGVADCLPVLLAARDGRAVAAAHAGWRGLAGGVLEATLAALQQGAGVAPDGLVAWLGPCIGPRRFEVGEDVLRAFGADPAAPDPGTFTPSRRADGSAAWLCNLPALARLRLQRAGVPQVAADGSCTVEDGSRFFSYRRDRVTGRMVAAIWLQR
jgi:polyphenol oxidase